jgi:NADPH:quinone reductase-like Zn-dependent oxidoreductase
MDAAVLHEPGSPRFGSFEEPVAGAGEAVVEVALAGLNPVDVTIAAGRFPGIDPPLPSVPGLEGVGRVGERRVYFGGTLAPFGSMAQRALAREEELFDVPDGLEDGLAAALGIAGLAAWLPLTWSAKLQPGESVLVLGASGVLGTIAVQAAKLLGAGRVIAAARDAEGLRVAAERGADATVNLAQTDDLAGALREAAGDGVDVVIDPLWGEPALAAMHACAPFARHVQIGNAASPTLQLPSRAFRQKGVTIHGYISMIVPLAERGAAYAALAGHAAAGRIAVDVERIPLREVESAWERQARSAHRKLVLVP